MTGRNGGADLVPPPGESPIVVLVRPQLAENIGAAAVELTPDDLRGIEEAASGIEVRGARYAEAAERMTGVEAPQPEGVGA